MLDVNPHITVETYHEQLNSENALRICDGYDVVSAQHRTAQHRSTTQETQEHAVKQQITSAS